MVAVVVLLAAANENEPVAPVPLLSRVIVEPLSVAVFPTSEVVWALDCPCNTLVIVLSAVFVCIDCSRDENCAS
jgi:hypothetical protein